MTIEYPKWLFHATAPARIVNDAEAHSALPPGWFESPGEAAAVEASAPDPSAPPTPPTVVADPPSDVESPEQAAARVASEKASLWKAPVATVVAKLEGCPKDTLEKLKAYESENPKPRVSLLAAIEAALSKVAA